MIFTEANVKATLLDPIGAPRILVRDVERVDTLDGPAFRATVVVHGVAFAAGNRGDGSANRYVGDPCAIDTARTLAATLIDRPEPLDALVADHIEKADLRAMLAQASRDGLCFVLPEDADEAQAGFRCVRGTGPDARAYVAAHYPRAIVLNDLLAEAA